MEAALAHVSPGEEGAGEALGFSHAFQEGAGAEEENSSVAAGPGRLHAFQGEAGEVEFLAGQERFFKEWRDLACDQGRRARRAKERSKRMAGRRSWGKEESRRRGKRRERKRGEGGRRRWARGSCYIHI